MDRSIIDRYLAGATVPLEGIAGLTDGELDAYPVPGTWSIRQIVVHLADSDVIGTDRMKRVIATENSTLLAYDQDAFTDKLGYATLDAELACRVFEVNRRFMAAILRQLPDEVFARVGRHSEDGPMTLETLVKKYVGHLEHHMGFLRKKREMLGKAV